MSDDFVLFVFFFSSRRRHTIYWRDWSSDVCSSDLAERSWERDLAFAAIISCVKVGVPREIVEGENRVGLVPETVGRLVREGFEVLVEAGAGRDYNLDENYEGAGARIVGGADAIYGGADIVVKVAKPTGDEIAQMREGLVLICFLNGPQEPELVRKLADAGVTVFSNEAIPRTSVAQSMDALSSMGSIAGYKCALIGANALGKYVPMLSTAAGTTKAAKVLVLGVAVAGLQAVAIMHRLGAEVFAYDIRPETKEQAQSLGAHFIDSEDLKQIGEEEDQYEEYKPEGLRGFMAALGFYSFAEPPRDEYIVEGEEEEAAGNETEVWSEEKLAEDQKLVRERIKEMDIVITTALVPGRKAPKLVDKEMVESMKPGSIIVDLAAESGGNCELTEAGETVEHENVEIIGPLNLPSRLPIHASQLYSRNMQSLIDHITEDANADDDDADEKDPQLELDFEDEIVDAMCIAHDGEIRHEDIREALQSASEESEAR